MTVILSKPGTAEFGLDIVRVVGPPVIRATFRVEQDDRP